jgi:hypothetical protein
MASAYPKVRYAASQEDWPKQPCQSLLFCEFDRPPGNPQATLLNFRGKMTHFRKPARGRDGSASCSDQDGSATLLDLGKITYLAGDFAQP